MVWLECHNYAFVSDISLPTLVAHSENRLSQALPALLELSGSAYFSTFIKVHFLTLENLDSALT